MRRHAGYTVTALGAAAGFSPTYVSMVEGGTRRPSARYRATVSKLFGVSEAFLFNGEVSR